jgi:hypothetical protein
MLHGEGFRYLHHREVIMGRILEEFEARVDAAIKAAMPKAVTTHGFYILERDGVYRWADKTKNKKAIPAIGYTFNSWERPEILCGLTMVVVNSHIRRMWHGGDRTVGLQAWLKKILA